MYNSLNIYILFYYIFLLKIKSKREKFIWPCINAAYIKIIKHKMS